MPTLTLIQLLSHLDADTEIKIADKYNVYYKGYSGDFNYDEVFGDEEDEIEVNIIFANEDRVDLVIYI